MLGEKLLNFLRTSERNSALAAELAEFVAEVQTVFEPPEILEYLSQGRHLRPLVHTPEDVLLLARMKMLLLAGG